MTTTLAAKYRPLLSATFAVIVLPFGLYLLGLSLNTGIMVVALAIAAMGSISASAIPGWSRSATAPGSASAPMRRG
ncbi:hypothetical protein [Bradyrhizobium hereditatis]|uniref:hypothetical protein n=1 Tax=Bradyrhizobium hereditatis TaxID=2821405 RepID=UPI001CE2A548|nr:hypothetical protein [Bradyrhizobium hereditatis]